MQAQTILILGGNGFIGTHIAAKLAKSHHVIVADLKIPEIKSPDIQYTSYDFLSTERYNQLFSNIDMVVHLISTNLPHDGLSNLETEINQNVFGTIHLLEHMKSHVKKLFFISSGGTVYGQNACSVHENSSKTPISSYGLTKSITEDVLNLYRIHEKFDIRIARLANPYGYAKHYNQKQGLIPIVVNNILTDSPITVWGDGNNIRDYIYIDDAVDAICLMINSDIPNVTLNIGSGKGYSTNDIIKKIAQKLNKKPMIQYSPARTCDVDQNILDISSIKQTYGWTPSVSLDKGITQIIQAFNSTKK